MILLLRLIFQNISRLTFQFPADRFQCGKPDCFRSVILQNRQIRRGYLYLSRKLRKSDLPPRHHDVNINLYPHEITSLYRQIILFFIIHCFCKYMGQYFTEQSSDKEYKNNHSCGGSRQDANLDHKHNHDAQTQHCHSIQTLDILIYKTRFLDHRLHHLAQLSYNQDSKYS